MAAMLSALRLFGRLGSLFDETQVSSGGTPATAVVQRDGTLVTTRAAVQVVDQRP